CEDQLIPTKVLVSKVTILNFPLRNTDEDWDTDGNADIYLIVRNGAREIIFQSPVIEDANNNTKYEFIPSSPIEIEIKGRDDYYDILELQGYDDEWNSQFIHGIIWPVYEENNRLPQEFDCWYHMIRRMGQAIEVARPTLFLLSDDAS